MKKLFLYSIINFLFFYSCGKKEGVNEPAAHYSFIEGTVTYSEDSLSLRNAIIYTDPPTFIDTTDQNGHFSLPAVRTGDYIIYASKIYYVTNSCPISVETGKTNNVQLNLSYWGPKPDTPKLLSPAENEPNIKIPTIFKWESSEYAERYSLHISTNEFFIDTVSFFNNIRETVMEVSGLNYYTKYYWRVKATNQCGDSKWSDWPWTWSFYTMSSPCPDERVITYCGREYHLIQIGDQCWLKENLNVGTMINGAYEQSDNGVLEKYCYDDNETNCDIYGGLYQWNEAMQYNLEPGSQGICPEEWHIPRNDEFETLNKSVNFDGNALKDIGQGEGLGSGTNISGFSALLAGQRQNEGGFIFARICNEAHFWSSTKEDPIYNPNNSFSAYLYHNYYKLFYVYTYNYYGFSIRCVKD